MLGSLNPCPFRVGGGPTPSSKAYGQIRRALGEGGSAPDDTGLDGLWRRSRAKGLAAATSSKRRALLQAFPHLATDAVPFYERATGHVAAPDESETARREAVASLWAAQLEVDLPSLSDELAAIDPRITLLAPSYATETISHFGRVFGPLDPSLGEPPFGATPAHSIAPNFATTFLVRVKFAVGYTGALTTDDARIYERCKARLRDILPSWVNFSVVTSTGFILNQSPLDLTGMNV